MKTRRARRILFSVTGALLLLAGCGGNDTERTNRLVVWTTEADRGAGEVMTRLEQEFERRHPGVDVVVETINWNDLSERLINASQSGGWPDVSHIQPFMAYSLFQRSELLPITDVRNDIEAANGPIFPAVRDLQVFGPNRDVYGIAYAVGTTFWSLLPEQLAPGEDLSRVRLWSDYLAVAQRARAANPERNRVTLPGGSPFFMDQLFAELVANAGGRLFDESGCPLLTSPQVISVLGFFRQMRDADILAADWPTQTYADQFDRLGAGTVVSVPVTYSRSALAIRAEYREQGRNPDDANERTIYWLDQPTQRGGLTSIATIDAEPWVVFRAASLRENASGRRNDELAREFLRMFYSQASYAAFTRTVPVQLTPIFERMATDPAYVATTRPFEGWHRRTLERLRNGSTRPILMPDLSESGRTLPFLLEFQRANILSGAISDVIQTDNTVQAAAERAQLRAIQVVRRVTNRNCGR